MPIKPSISRLRANLKRHMDELDVGWVKLAGNAGLKPSAVRDIFRGKSDEPGVFRVYALAKYLGCTVEELIGDSKGGDTHINNLILLKKIAKGLDEVYREAGLQLKADQMIEIAVPLYEQAQRAVDQATSVDAIIEGQMQEVSERLAELQAAQLRPPPIAAR